MADKATNQHWVPRFYLRYFSTPDTRLCDQPKVWILSKRDEDGEERMANVKNVCSKRYLYSPRMPDGERTWDLEEKLAGLETTLGPLWSLLAEGFASLEDGAIRKGLGLFVAVMYLRNPLVREQVERLHKQILELCATAPTLPDGTPDIGFVEHGSHRSLAESWFDYWQWGKDEHDRFFAETVQSEAVRIAELLMQKRWSVVFAEHDAFITSDRPVSIHHPQRQVAGFGTAGAMILFPLSPTRLLVMDDLHHEPPNQYYPLRAQNAGGFNLSVWRGAGRFLITGRPIADVLSELVAFADVVAGNGCDGQPA